MTIGEWLATRQPRPPAALMDGLTNALGPDLERDAGDGASVFLATAEKMLRSLVTAGETGREVAGDLLTIDALTTYALESATETLNELPEFADDSMSRIANIMMPGSADRGRES